MFPCVFWISGNRLHAPLTVELSDRWIIHVKLHCVRYVNMRNYKFVPTYRIPRYGIETDRSDRINSYTIVIVQKISHTSYNSRDLWFTDTELFKIA